MVFNFILDQVLGSFLSIVSVMFFSTDKIFKNRTKPKNYSTFVLVSRFRFPIFGFFFFFQFRSQNRVVDTKFSEYKQTFNNWELKNKNKNHTFMQFPKIT